MGVAQIHSSARPQSPNLEYVSRVYVLWSFFQGRMLGGERGMEGGVPSIERNNSARGNRGTNKYVTLPGSPKTICVG
jgi:hypothetical protein